MWCLLAILVVIVGFVLKLDSILVVVLAAAVAAITGGISIPDLFDVIGTNFVANRGILVFMVSMLLTGTLERNGLRNVATSLIGRVKSATCSMLYIIYGLVVMLFAAFNVAFGGAANMIRPVLLPMEIGAVESKGKKASDKHVEEMKGLSSAVGNVGQFFGQMLFVGGGGALLVQGTLNSLGYPVELIDIARVQIPVAVAAIVLMILYCIVIDKVHMKKFYQPDEKH